MKKTWLAILAAFALTAVLAAMLAGCGIKKVESGQMDIAEDDWEEDTEEKEPEIDGEVAGGWTVVESPAKVKFPKDIQTAYDKVMEDFGDSIVPMAYIARQVDGATNYMFLCRDNDENELETVVISDADSEDADCVITIFDIADYTEGNGAHISGDKEAGDWEVPEDYTKGELPEDVRKAYDKAVKKLTTNNLTPVAYLGSQVVAGSNYAILCRAETMAEDASSLLQMAIVYQDLAGNAEITNLCTIDPAELAE